jgi:hypothetical protein
MSEKNPLRVGDRVAVYGPVMTWDKDGFGCCSDNRKGTILSHIDDLVQFEDDENHVRYLAHRKQARRLVPKKRREFILGRSSQGILGVTEIGLPVQNGERIRVREVFK